jgi:hypothetical protein
MKRTYLLSCLALTLMWGVSGCGPDGREAGDDPTRADEGPTAGRPTTDPSSTVDRPDASGGGQAVDESARVPDDGRGTLDGSSDEAAAREDATTGR